jgi:uncharacterized cupin superfamily protein
MPKFHLDFAEAAAASAHDTTSSGSKRAAAVQWPVQCDRIECVNFLEGACVLAQMSGLHEQRFLNLGDGDMQDTMPDMIRRLGPRAEVSCTRFL